MRRTTISEILLIFAASTLVGACTTGTDTSSPDDDSVEALTSNGAVNKQINDPPDAGRIKVPDYEQIRQRYRRNAEDFDRIAIQLEKDHEITELYCDRNMIAVTTQDETYYDGESDPYTSKYAQLCRFTSKVAALRSAKGIRFPHRYFEAGPLAISNFLEKHDVAAGSYDACGSPLFDGERGACAVAINDNWSATYEWKTFCLEHMKGEAGCE